MIADTIVFYLELPVMLAHNTCRSTAEHKDVPLRVLGPRRSRAVARRSWISRWRAAALIGVHLLMTAHVLHWWITGRSFGRFVLSDSMQTIELGEINPGVILFVLTLLSTALLGRFMCGWVCHIGALQDLSTWVLRKMGVRPRLFRSRLLGFVPLGLAIYMFLWPTFKRELLAPALKPVWPEAAASLAVNPFPGFSLNLTTDHFWDGLPSLWVGVPFLLVAGFLVIFFLGARGLCRYACPYGGFLLPAEQLATGRVTVDMSKCDQCGLCTAACTTGVRVHDEVRVHGSVTDRNCIRSFDCVGACPTRALTFSIGRPAFMARHGTAEKLPARHDLTWLEEIVCLAIFLGAFFTLRGLYQNLPLLMAAPLAIVVAYLGWKTLRLWREPHVVFARLQLRHAGRLTGAGRVFLAGTVLVTAFLLHSAAVRLLIWRGEYYDNLVTVSSDAAFAQQGVPDADRINAGTALRLYRLAGSCWREGQRGVGLAFTPEVSIRVSWLEIVSGRPQAAIDELEALRRTGRAADGTIADYASLIRRDGNADLARTVLQETLTEQPTFFRCRDLLASLLMEAGRPPDAERLYQARLVERPTDVMARTGLARVLFVTGRETEALSHLQEASRRSPRVPEVARDHALALHALGRPDDAVMELKRGATARPSARNSLLGLAAQILRQYGREAEAMQLDGAANP